MTIGVAACGTSRTGAPLTSPSPSTTAAVATSSPAAVTASTIAPPPTTAPPVAAPPAASAPTTAAPPPAGPPTTRRSSVDVSSATSQGGLTVTLTASPPHAAPGETIDLTLSAQDANAHGVLGYQLSYGDGTGSHPAVPLLCTATVSPRSETWSLTHAYGSAGTYTVSATVTASCTPDRATASVSVAVP